MAKNLRTSLKQSIRASSKASLVGSNVFGSSPLDLRFALQKTLDSRVTFTRASTGTYVGSDGAIKTATTNEARFDHNPTTGESLGLLVEESRTNLLLRSEEFDNASWTKSTGTPETAITANAIASPSGPVTADLFYAVNTGAGVRFTIQSITKAASPIQYTYSLYIKAKEVTFATFSCDDGAGNGFSAGVNLSTGATTGGAVGTGASFTSVGAINVGNGWYRCSITGTSNSATTVRVAINLATSLVNGFPSVTLNANDGLYVWGAQLEAGAFPTSYIPTTSATATRAADVASVTGSNFSSWYNQTEGTVFAEAIPRASGFNGGLISFDNGTTDERIQARLNSGLAASLVVSDGAVVQANILSLNTISAGALARGGYVYKADDFAVTLNGTAPVSDTSGTLPTPTQATVGNAVGASYLNGTIKRLTYWPVRLSNTTLQAITTP